MDFQQQVARPIRQNSANGAFIRSPAASGVFLFFYGRSNSLVVLAAIA
jgi:hypothetical protein